MVEQEIRINLEAPAILVSQFLPMLSTAAEAAVVNISSGLALVPKASAPVYCATKAALHSFSKALRYQFNDAGGRIKVFEVLPPLVDTDMTRGRRSGKISPEDVAVATLEGMLRDRYEIRVAKVRLLYWIYRFAPGLAERALRGK
jgi:short-subunit dehydrogenase involved in D-alanine esterification of teichoic acids